MSDSSVHKAMEGLKLDDSFLLVAAIDFGTTFSGYAFSFKDSPNNISMNKNWGSSIVSLKAPTVVLTNPDGSFNSFGYEAEEEYLQHEPDEGYQIYRCFKMVLHKKVSTCSQGVSYMCRLRDLLTILGSYWDVSIWSSRCLILTYDGVDYTLGLGILHICMYISSKNSNTLNYF